jgi:hypothetical protein
VKYLLRNNIIMDRRDFLKASAIVSASSLLTHTSADAQRVRTQRIAIRNHAADSIKTRLAARELITGLRMLHAAPQITLSSDNAIADTATLTLQVEPSRFKKSEEYEITASGQNATLYAMNEQALLYAVFDFLERQGLVFGIDGTIAPIDPPSSLQRPGTTRFHAE